MPTEVSTLYTPEQIDEQLAEAKRCKVFVDILNGDTPCLGVTSGFMNSALNVGLSAAVRLGEIVEQQRSRIAWLEELSMTRASVISEKDRVIEGLSAELKDDKPDLCRPNYVGHKTLAWVQCCPLDNPCDRHKGEKDA